MRVSVNDNFTIIKLFCSNLKFHWIIFISHFLVFIYTLLVFIYFWYSSGVYQGPFTDLSLLLCVLVIYSKQVKKLNSEVKFCREVRIIQVKLQSAEVNHFGYLMIAILLIKLMFQLTIMLLKIMQAEDWNEKLWADDGNC